MLAASLDGDSQTSKITIEPRVSLTAHDSSENIPLVVDLDGTLLKVDTLHEAFIQFASTKPLLAMRALMKAPQDRAAFKAIVADHVIPDAKTTPINQSLLQIIKQARQEGRKVFLATAADRRVAEAIVNSIGEFDGFFASERNINLKGKAKADCLVAAFGAHGFDYIGNDAADIPVWRMARTALVCGASPRLLHRIQQELPAANVVGAQDVSVAPYLQALRPHQWVKNALVALPAIAAHSFTGAHLIAIVIAFLSFSFGASGIYLLNDLFDLPHDRAHREKRHRSIAKGLVPVSHATALLATLGCLSIVLALTLPPAFLLVLVGYFSLSISYSLYLKRKLMIDVVALAALYGIRVLAGGAATLTFLSHWLIGFCFFIFLNLALIKRTAELLALPEDSAEKIKGRGYRRADLQTVTGLTAAAGFVSVLILALYIASPEVAALYRHPEILWGICIILVYWLGRICLLAGRSEMNQDPVLFAVTDRISLLAGLLVLLVFWAAL